MSETVQLQCELRERTGKGGARALRRTGWVPAIVYGGEEPPLKVALFERQVKRELERNPRFFSSVVELALAGGPIRAVPREAQLHPVNDLPLHVDFVRATKGATVHVEIPVQFLNEDKSPGLKRGGVLNIVRREIELICPVEAIPELIAVDLGQCEIGDSVHISAVSLPPNAELTITDRDFTICTIVGRGGSVDDGDEDGSAAAGAAETATISGAD